ncbi:hypothetical protein Ait01nite_032270 [Actinoplanes italicus]|uniref:Uncharacterized protein n=1 Tax=Actinoplanes italicus TaxID=113567 RepID=A0A2T0KJH1_9ACTN|nr:hypothetical protein [Actinoplanes italicus]PRX23680.1 hypothetical protein CLV67_103429 [Actinoplanes italicus]GIE30182.1 hypothetical protein Ait01nite_032270 [Actinoplanes italicus]
MPAAYRLLIDWLANGFADTAVDDVTARTLDQRQPLTFRYGRDQARQFSPTSPGEAGFMLDNRSRDYSPENTSSPVAGFVTPGRPVKFQATSGATTTVLYTGYLDDFEIKPGINDRAVPATCMDALGRMRGVQVTTPLYQAIKTGEAIGYLLDAIGWPADARDLDAGVSVLPFWWLDDTDAFDALMQLADSEGPAALVTVDGQGRIVFRDRHHRLTRTQSLNVQSTWRSSGTEPCISDPVSYNHGWKEIVNAVSADVQVRTVAVSPSQVWSSQGLITIPAGTPVTVTAQAGQPFTGALNPVAGTDYTLVSGTVSIGISRTSGQSTVITLTSAAGAIVQDLSLRAQAITSTTVTVTVEEPSSIAQYGRKSLDGGRLPTWANPYDTLAILQLIVGRRSERLPTITVTMRGAGGAARLAECLGRNLSDRIHLTESLTGLDSDCFIEQISHTVGSGGLEHVTTFGLEKIPAVVSTPFTFDVAGRGFDDGRFVGDGLDNPATMFRFDTAGQGFDQGVFSY